jgi:hypothetical protein
MSLAALPGTGPGTGAMGDRKCPGCGDRWRHGGSEGAVEKCIERNGVQP